MGSTKDNADSNWTLVSVITQKHLLVIKLNIENMQKLRPLPKKWIIVINESPSKKLVEKFSELSQISESIEIVTIFGYESGRVRGLNPSYEHSNLIHLGISHASSSKVLLIDPDFFIVKRDAFDFLNRKLERSPYFSVPWGPRWYTKTRNSATPHFFAFKNNSGVTIDFTPAKLAVHMNSFPRTSVFPRIIQANLGRRRIESVQDTGYKIPLHSDGSQCKSKSCERFHGVHISRANVDFKLPKGIKFEKIFSKFISKKLQFFPKSLVGLNSDLSKSRFLSLMLDKSEVLIAEDEYLGFHLRTIGREKSYLQNKNTLIELINLSWKLSLERLPIHTTKANTFIFVRNLAHWQYLSNFLLKLSLNLDRIVVLTFDQTLHDQLIEKVSSVSHASELRIKFQSIDPMPKSYLWKIFDGLRIKKLWCGSELKKYDFYRDRQLKLIPVKLKNFPTSLLNPCIAVISKAHVLLTVATFHRYNHMWKFAERDFFITTDAVWPQSVQARHAYQLEARSYKGLHFILSWDNAVTKGSLNGVTWPIFAWDEIQKRQFHDLHEIKDGDIKTGSSIRYRYTKHEYPLNELNFPSWFKRSNQKYVYLCASPRVLAQEEEMTLIGDYLAQISPSYKGKILIKLHPDTDKSFVRKVFKQPYSKRIELVPLQGNQKQDSGRHINEMITYMGALTTAIFRMGLNGRYLIPRNSSIYQRITKRTPHTENLLESLEGVRLLRLSRKKSIWYNLDSEKEICALSDLINFGSAESKK
jgi:hypothetical protein